MGITLYTATGCTRCKIVKAFMHEHGIAFEERDMKAEGKEDFKKFYAANRQDIFRGPDGVEFPIFSDGTVIRQGIGSVVAYLSAGTKLNGFFTVGTLHKEWVDGIHVSGGCPEYAEEFLTALRFLKKNAMKLQMDTNGKNSQILSRILKEGLAEVVIMNVLGPQTLYEAILGEAVDVGEIQETMTYVARFPKYQFQTTVVPVLRGAGDTAEISYLTPQEIGETSKWMAEVTGSKKLPYLIRLYHPTKDDDECFKSIEPMTSNQLLLYRSSARVNQVMTEVEKGE